MNARIEALEKKMNKWAWAAGQHYNSSEYDRLVAIVQQLSDRIAKLEKRNAKNANTKATNVNHYGGPIKTAQTELILNGQKLNDE